jgi:hypothetical protein
LQQWRRQLPRDPAHPAAPAHTSAVLPPRGEWPPDPFVTLPFFLSEDLLAHLLDRSVRTLQRRRRLGKSPPFTKNGKEVLYPRDPALIYFGAAAA